MRLKSLQYLIELDKAGSLYAASKRMMISQQGFSKAIASLENELGVQLVRRTPHGTRLTNEGLVVLDSARKIVAEHESMMARLYEAEGESSPPAERISIHVSHYAAQIASIDPEYVRLLSANTLYVEEPFDKLLMRAEGSDGSGLIFTEVFSQSLGAITDNPNLSFEPIIQTRYGLIWKEGSALEGLPVLHRGDVCDLPIVLDSNREARRLTDTLFEKHPLTNVLMGTESPRMLLEYVQVADGRAYALGDSFAFYIMQREGLPSTESLRFTPFATLKSVVQIGFVLPRRAQLTPQALHAMRTLRRYLAAKCPDYS